MLPPELLGQSPAVIVAADAVHRAARSYDPVLIVAERGFNAERIARAIHGAGPFCAFDCADRSADHAVRDLFGRTPGRRTDLETVDSGSLLARARGGTLLLSNIAQLPAAAQLRLWRLLRDGEMRLGSRTTALNVRVVGAAHPGLEHDVADQRFRRDLYERLQRLRVDVPSLRERRDDLPAIVRAVLDEVCREHQTERTLAPAALTALTALPWPGNLDELRRVLERLVTGVTSGVIRQEDVLGDLQPPRPQPRPVVSSGTLREARLSFERDYIAAVLQEHGWRMSDAARTLGIERANLYRKIRQLGITRLKPSRVS